MANATWILRKISTGLNLWKGEGAAPPEIVTDPQQLREVFSLSFPAITLTWGPGDFELMAVNQGLCIRVATVVAYTLPGSARVGSAEEVPTTHQTHNLHGARIVTDESFTQEVAERTAAPRCFTEEGPKADPGILAADTHPRPASYLKPADPADYQMLLTSVERRILMKSDTWADRLKALPHISRSCRDERRASTSDATPILPLTGRMHVGMGVSHYTDLPSEVFYLAPSCQTRAYLRWFEAYQRLEAIMTHPEGVEAGEAPVLGLRLSLRMAHDAHLLYLHEQGLCGSILHPDNVIFDADVDAEMRKRADFLAAKDADYGQAMRRHGIPGILTRLWDKISRYTNLKSQSYGGSTAPNFESMEDSLRDLGGYSLILAGFFQEALEAQDPRHPLTWADVPTQEGEDRNLVTL